VLFAASAHGGFVQLHCDSKSRSICARNRTRPQWQPPSRFSSIIYPPGDIGLAGRHPEPLIFSVMRANLAMLLVARPRFQL